MPRDPVVYGASMAHAREFLRPRSRLERIATAQGVTVPEYLMEHLNYKLSVRDLRKWRVPLLDLAARRIEEQRKLYVDPVR